MQFLFGVGMSVMSLMTSSTRPYVHLVVNALGCAVLAYIAWAWRPCTYAWINRIQAMGYSAASFTNTVSLVAFAITNHTGGVADDRRYAFVVIVALGWVVFLVYFLRVVEHDRFVHPGSTPDLLIVRKSAVAALRAAEPLRSPTAMEMIDLKAQERLRTSSGPQLNGEQEEFVSRTPKSRAESTAPTTGNPGTSRDTIEKLREVHVIISPDCSTDMYQALALPFRKLPIARVP